MHTIVYRGPYLQDKNIEIQKIQTSGRKEVHRKIKNLTMPNICSFGNSSILEVI